MHEIETKDIVETGVYSLRFRLTRFDSWKLRTFESEADRDAYVDGIREDEKSFRRA